MLRLWKATGRMRMGKLAIDDKEQVGDRLPDEIVHPRHQHLLLGSSFSMVSTHFSGAGKLQRGKFRGI
jgi:hypothetical protein